MEIVFFWLLFSIAVGVYAGNKGRSGFGFFVLSILVSPIIGFIFAIAVDNLKDKRARPSPDTHVKCPDCRELVLKDAKRCKHCGVSLIPQ